MHFAPELGDSLYKITHYDQTSLRINNTDYTQPLVVTPNALFHPWAVTSLATLRLEDFDMLKTYKPQLILLGTGQHWQMLPAVLQAALMQQGIGVEVMTTEAACRTFNVLQAEGRRVAAALWPPSDE